MTLTKCRRCWSEVSKSATKCPHCGRLRVVFAIEKDKGLAYVVVVLLVLVAAWLVWMFAPLLAEGT